MTDKISNLPKNISTFVEARSGKLMSYAPPGVTFAKGGYISDYSDRWHQFLLWDRHTDFDESRAFVANVRDWCAANKVREPRIHPIRRISTTPISVIIGPDAKAMLFKLTFGGGA